MLKQVKRIILKTARAAGAYTLIRESRWRQQRLLILGYHGVAQNDEHLWNPELYIPSAQLEQRLSMLRDGGYNVLSLDIAVRALFDGTLPAKSVALTFDDGLHDFYSVAYPMLQKYQVPATVYLTTFYCSYQRPVFDVMLNYLLWRGRNAVLDTTGLHPSGRTMSLDAIEAREALTRDIRRFVSDYSAEQKDAVLSDIAERIGISYDSVIQKRILQLMSPSEVSLLDPKLIQVELHTHRHRVPLDESKFRREIVDNRKYIVENKADHRNPVHFCYPSGVTKGEFMPWLQQLGVQSATTCEPGIASPASHPPQVATFSRYLFGLAGRI